MGKAKKQSDSFADKWSEGIEKGGFTAIPNCLLWCKHAFSLSNTELVVLIEIISVRFSVKNPTTTAEVVAKRMGQSVSTARAAFRSLEKKGLVGRIFITGSPSVYDMSPLVHRLESHVCTNPIRIQTPPYPKTATKPYPNIDTKEEVRRRIVNKNNSFNSIGEILKAKPRPP